MKERERGMQFVSGTRPLWTAITRLYLDAEMKSRLKIQEKEF